MRKLITFAAAVAFVGSAFAARIVTDVSVPTTNTTAYSVTLTDVAATNTAWVGLYGLLVTVPAHTDVNVAFFTQVGGVNAQVGDTLRLYNGSAAAVVECHMPRKTVISNRNTGQEMFPLYGTNSSIRVTSAVAGTNTWAFKLLIDQ